MLGKNGEPAAIVFNHYTADRSNTGSTHDMANEKKKNT